MAIDGIRGKMTDAAILRAKSKGYNVDLNTGRISKISKPLQFTLTSSTNLAKKLTKSAHNTLKTIKDNTEKARLMLLKQTSSLPSNLSSNSFADSMLNYINRGKANMGQIARTAQRQYESIFPTIEGYELPEDFKTIIAHKTKYNVDEPYLWVDRKAGRLFKLQRNKVLEDIPIATGVNRTSDGFSGVPLTPNGKPIYDRSLTNSATPGGIFTLSEATSGYFGQPAYHLIEAERGNNNEKRYLLASVHTPATRQREQQLNAGEKGLTYGCIQLPNGRMSCVNPGDSVYVSFSRPGNGFYEDPNDGLIKPRITNAPKLESGTTWGKQYNNVKVQYNYGY